MAAAVETVSIPQHTIPSKDRIEPGSFNTPLGQFPATASSTAPDAEKVVEGVIASFNQALSKKDYQAVSDLFLDDGYWRDHLVLSWDLRTLKGKDTIAKFLASGCGLASIAVDKASAFRSPRFGPIDGLGEVNGIEFFITVETLLGSGRGLGRLAEKDGQWKIFTFFTTLQQLNGCEEPTNGRRTKGVEHGGNPDRKNWLEKRQEEVNFEGTEPVVLVVGAGQAGLTVAARLKMLGVNTLVIDNEVRIGDSWRRRYRQLVLHDPVWFDHMPYLNFPSHWPVFTPKDKLADFFEIYVKVLELNVWTQTDLKSCSWDDGKKEWTITLDRKEEDGSTETRTLHPRHVIQATGHSGKKYFPDIKGIDAFKGDRLCHSSEFPGARTDAKGKKAVVVGSCNSGHDIAQDYYEKGYDVTMVQRSSTCVISSEAITEIGLKGLYDENGPPTEDADVWLWSMPSELLKSQQVKVTQIQNQHDAQILQGLEKAGFRLDKGPNDSGLLIKYFQRGGGYYIDVGASQLIIDGKIKIKQGQEITEVAPNSLKFADGSELPADEIVFATGYQNMRTQARIIFGDQLADRIGDVWGFDREGEMRSIWRPTGHPGFWFMGGNLAMCRYYSRLLALQIKALVGGLAS